MSKEEVDIFCPANAIAFRNWLENNHKIKPAVWLIFYKKSSKNHNLTWSEAVDEALCFGWIDSKKKTIDEESYMQYYCKRKPTSTWSKINKNKIEKLIDNGHMTDSGMEVISMAKENGSWIILDDVEALIVPKDLEQAFQENHGAKDFYLQQSDSMKKGFLAWIALAKRPVTRQKRIDKIVLHAFNRELAKYFR